LLFKSDQMISALSHKSLLYSTSLWEKPPSKSITIDFETGLWNLFSRCFKKWTLFLCSSYCSLILLCLHSLRRLYHQWYGGEHLLCHKSDKNWSQTSIKHKSLDERRPLYVEKWAGQLVCSRLIVAWLSIGYARIL